MSKSVLDKRTLIAANALLLAVLAGVHNEAASQETLGSSAAVDAQDQARRLLQRPDITASWSATAAPTVIKIARSAVPDAQEQARRMLSRPGIGTLEATEVEGAALTLNPERADAHTLAAQLLLKPTGY
jgi:hypothetical protein